MSRAIAWLERLELRLAGQVIATGLEAIAVAGGLVLVVGVLAGCAGDVRQVEIPEQASVAAAVACVDEELRRELEAACPRPRTDAEILALDDYKAVQALRADRGQAAICSARLQAAVQSCAKIPALVSPPPPLSVRRE